MLETKNFFKYFSRAKFKQNIGITFNFLCESFVVKQLRSHLRINTKFYTLNIEQATLRYFISLGTIESIQQINYIYHHLIQYSNMKKIVLAFTVLCFVFLSQQLIAQTPSWTNGIACIVYSHCTNCHNDNGIAPFSLTTYDKVNTYKSLISAAVQSKSMPPFPANQDKQNMRMQTL